MRNLILTGGIRHDFSDNTRAVDTHLSAVGIASEVWEDIDAGIDRLTTGDFDLVTVMALRWPMEGDPKYAPYRAEWRYEMPPGSARHLQTFVESGGGLFGLHTASLCFEDWPGWKDLLGGTWRWGRSYHPPRCALQVSPTGHSHEIVANLSGFDITDELFSDLDLTEGVVPLLEAKTRSGESVQPVLWARSIGKGRGVYDALGHDRVSLDHPVHLRLLQRCALWAGGADSSALPAL